jgi:hypothetical protein
MLDYTVHKLYKWLDFQLEVMSLDELPEVKIERSGSLRFILVRGPDERHFIRGADVPRHASIFTEQFYNELNQHSLDPLSFSAIGGGMMQFEEARLIAFGKSGTYGRFDPAITMELLQRYAAQNLPGFSVEIK